MPESENSALKLLVIGCVSLDRLHLNGQVIDTIGGAGLYTALAALKAGAQVTLLAPKPNPMPARCAWVDEHLEWVGPVAREDGEVQRMPRLEIAHHGGGRATLLSAGWGAEADLQPDHLPADLSAYGWVHIAALSSAERQLEFMAACRARKASRVSAGTYGRLALNSTAAVRRLFEQADACFMNENECNGLFGYLDAAYAREGQLVFVTLAERGALAINAAGRTSFPGLPSVEVDPTGAGDTFCGTVLAGLLRAMDIGAAARAAIVASAAMIQHAGPAALMD